MQIKIQIRRLARRRLRLTKSAPYFFEEVPLWVESLEFIQHPIRAINGGQLDLIFEAHALVKIEDPLLSPQLDIVVEGGAIFAIGHNRADSGPGTVEVSLGHAEYASGSFELALECLDPRLSCNS